MKIKGIFKKIHGKDEHGEQQQSKKYYVEFRDHLDRRHRTPAFADSKISAEYLRQLERLVEYRTSNIALPLDAVDWIKNLHPDYVERIVKRFGLLDEQWLAANEVLSVHLAAYGESLAAADRTAEHVELYQFRINRLLTEAGVTRWNELTTEKVRRTWLALETRSKKPLSNGTRNHYLVAFKSFCNWMENNGRAATNPAKGIKPLKVTGRRERHPFSIAEFSWLVESTRRGPVRSAPRNDGTLHFQLSGSERVLLYTTAVETALRLKELNSLQVCDFDLAGDQPCVQLRAANAKNRKAPPPCPLSPELAKQLREQFDGKLPVASAFNGPDGTHAARMLREDMVDARAEWIAASATPEERDERGRSDFLAPFDHRGRVADFHALRATTATWLVEAEVSPYAMQKLMRHSDIRTTMAHYAKVRPSLTRAALEQLPKLRLTGA